MPHTTNGVDALISIVVIAAVFFYTAYWLPWKREDRDRRRDRIVQRRLEEMDGRWHA
jgi:hypothetical protein